MTRGRPRKPKEDKRTEPISFYVTPKEKERLMKIYNNRKEDYRSFSNMLRHLLIFMTNANLRKIKIIKLKREENLLSNNKVIK